MERTLTEDERKLAHRHSCPICSSPAAHLCYCDERRDGEFAKCSYRVPGERNPDCPAAAALGTEHLTGLMRAEYGN